MIDERQISKAASALKIIFWVQVVMLVLDVGLTCWPRIFYWPIRLGGPAYMLMRSPEVHLVLGGISAAVTLFIALRLVSRLARRATVWPLRAVVVIKACLFAMMIGNCAVSIRALMIRSFVRLLVPFSAIFLLADLACMYLLSLFASWLCRDAVLPEAEARWTSTARGFLFIHIVPNAVYVLLYLLVLFPHFKWLRFIHAKLIVTGVAVLTRYPLLLFHNSAKEMATDAHLAAAGRMPWSQSSCGSESTS